MTRTEFNERQLANYHFRMKNVPEYAQRMRDAALARYYKKRALLMSQEDYVPKKRGRQATHILVDQEEYTPQKRGRQRNQETKVQGLRPSRLGVALPLNPSLLEFS